MNMQVRRKILAINDIAGYGKVALSAMIPILSHMGFHVCNLPTAVVSNTLDYGRFRILDTTGYMRDALKVWAELRFSFDAVSTGFIVSEEQMMLIRDFCEETVRKGTKVFNDPIMGDDGRLYNGVSPDTIAHMRGLVGVSELTVPNYTEACFLADVPYRPEGADAGEMKRIIGRLREIGAKSVVVTSAVLEGRKQVAGFDAAAGTYFSLPYDEIPVRFPGTGDIFSSVLFGSVLEGMPLR
ncbi:MAG: bifunctional hydroxymethylpyrimidine kinase/phosphomethylpyrimidine kinase, partial [Mailhella sp.]|nr:bifunctional hydroxymethylpyrimidine kinase/phosphomethylpyrimidine kinase [Mailhella sp.]